jgi:predicted RNA-binding Zn-ribbon protein involved in translation (DUF1610 family)
VTGWNTEIRGLITKKQVTRVGVKAQTSDEYLLEFESRDMGSSQLIIQTLSEARMRESAGVEITNLLRVRDRVQMSEVCAILTKYQLANAFEDGQRYVEYSISSGQVQGVFNGKEYVSKLAMQSESVRYDIVAKFEMSENGAIVFKCPTCGASLPLTTKESTGKCQYCGSSYAIPRKLLDAI